MEIYATISYRNVIREMKWLNPNKCYSRSMLVASVMDEIRISQNRHDLQIQEIAFIWIANKVTIALAQIIRIRHVQRFVILHVAAYQV